MSDYDPEKPSTFITYFDKNNLYGWSMSEYLPYGENDYPLAPEKLAVTNDMLSKYYKEIAGKYDVKVDDLKKLIPNLKKQN